MSLGLKGLNFGQPHFRKKTERTEQMKALKTYYCAYFVLSLFVLMIVTCKWLDIMKGSIIIVLVVNECCFFHFFFRLTVKM